MKTTFRHLFAVAVLLAASVIPASAQDEPDMFDILLDYINEEQNTALTRLQEDIAKGEKLVSQAETMDKTTQKFFDSGKKGKQKKGEKKSVEQKSLRIKAQKYYLKSYEQLYEIYKAVLDEAQFEYQADQASAEDLMIQAEVALQECSTKFDPYGKLGAKSLETKPYNTLKTDMANCKQKCLSAGNDCYEALKLYAIQTEKKNREAAAEQNYWNQAVQANTIASYNGYLSRYPSGKYVADAKKRIENLQQSMSRTKRVTSDDPNEGLAYRIQILADKSQWNPNKLKRLYRGNLKVEETEREGFYKYWIGCFRSYAEAQDAEKSMHLRESFIVSFYNGVQIHITEAQQIESQLED
ncbi:MAG: hypothetical protein K6F33_15830 [Bacteroidales bacterium]|nr:hypothetical protein [Bacteroidales bacterium]